MHHTIPDKVPFCAMSARKRFQRRKDSRSGLGTATVFAAVCLLAMLTGCRGTPQQREASYMERARQDAGARNYNKSVIELKVASQNMPKDPEPVYRLGMTYLSAGSGRLALVAFQKVVTLNPKHQGARYQLALFGLGSSKKEI